MKGWQCPSCGRGVTADTLLRLRARPDGAWHVSGDCPGCGARLSISKSGLAVLASTDDGSADPRRRRARWCWTEFLATSSRRERLMADLARVDQQLAQLDVELTSLGQ